MDWNAVRRGLATAAETAAVDPPLTGYGYYPDSPVLPAFVAGPGQVVYTQSTMGRGIDVVVFTCFLYVARADDLSSQELLDALMSGGGGASMKAALEGQVGVPQTLGGACHDLMVTAAKGPTRYTYNDVALIGAELTVKVVGSGA